MVSKLTNPKNANKLKISLIIVAIAIIAVIFSAVSALNNNQNQQDTIQTVDSNETDLFPYKVNCQYAEGFNVEYHSNYKVVNIIDPWKRASENYTYLLVQKGTQVPEGYDNAEIFYTPVENVAALSTTQIPHIANIGEIESIKAVSSIKSINTEGIIDRYDNGLVCEISTGNDIDAEKIIEIEPEVVFTTAMQNAEYDSQNKLKELGLKPAVVSEWMEKTPLARAEWIKYFSLFYNKEEEADTLFTEIELRYNTASEKAKEIYDRPTVFSGSNYQGTWYMPGGESYVAKMLEDAGADYIFSDDNSTGSIPFDFEFVYEKASDADFWINPGTAKSIENLLIEDERYANFDALQNGNIFNNNARINEFGGNDYWESGVARPDIVLMDLIKIFHPEIIPEHELYYFRQLN